MNAGGIPYISSVNSTTTALGSSVTFTGSWERAFHFGSVMAAVISDAAGTLYMQFSPDGTNIDSELSFDVAASTNEIHRLSVSRGYFRIKYVNGSSAQSYMRLQTIFGHSQSLTSSFNSSIQQDSDTIVTRSLPMEIDIASGKVAGFSIVNKVGRNPDIDTGTVPEDVWDNGGGTYTGFPTGSAETVQVLSSSTDDASAGIGARTIRITGLDANYAIISETFTLNGTTPVTGSLSFIRVHTAAVLTAGSNNFNVGVITVRHSTTTTNVFMGLQIGTNQSNSSGYTVPAGKTAYMRKIHGSIRGGTSAAVDAVIWTRAFNAAPRLRRPFTIANTDRFLDEIYGGLVFTEKTDIILRVTASSANNADVVAGYDLLLIDD